MVHHPFDRDFGIEPAGFDQSGLGFVHFARLRIGGGQVRVGIEIAMTRIDRMAILVDRRVEMAEVQLRVGHYYLIYVDVGIARTQPHRLLRIGLRLLVVAEAEFAHDARREQRNEVGTDRESGLGRYEGFAGAARVAKILSLD